jgi:SAM-dependent methyltransferase
MSNAPTRDVARIYNSYIASAAMAGAWEIGALDTLASERRLSITAYAQTHDLDVESTRALFTALCSVQITEIQGDEVLPSVNFDEAFRAKPFFHWLVRGSSDLFTRMPEVLRKGERVGDFYQRDSAAIAVACRDINATFFDPVFWAAMEGIECTKVADFGCGSGERLLQILRRFPEAQGVGVDIAAGAIGVATEASRLAGMTHRLTFLQGDARYPDDRPEFRGVDLVTCFMMGHDFWPLEDCVQWLERLRAAFPDVKKFLLGDTARTVPASATDFPVFTLGFEVGHALMGTYLPTLEEWETALGKSSWTCVQRHVVTTPADTVIFELEPW